MLTNHLLKKTNKKNIRSLHAHYNELLCYLDTLDIEFKILALSETALNKSSINYTILNYNCETNYRVKG